MVCVAGVRTAWGACGVGDNQVAEAVGSGFRLCSAGLPLTDSDPRLINPGDLLHMREGDVPSIKIHQALQYVGHLKSPPLAVAGNEPAQP
jgi:hypothetical protein